jgi:hypothetical protein
MSPEQARGGDVDGRSDLFSLGCILYECLTGRRPFGGDSVTAILLKIVNEDPPAVDFDALCLPAALGGVLRKALAKDPANRYPTGERLVAAAREAARSAVDTLGGAAATERPAPLVPPPAPVPPPVPAHVFSVPAPPADPRPATPPAPSPRRGSPWKLAALAAAAIVAAVVVWGVSASQRGFRPAAAAKAPQEDPQIVRVSANVTREEPTMVKRLMGAKPRLHVTVPEGTSLSVRLDTPLSSETARPEQAFTASTDLPLVVDGFETFPAGSRITGHVAHAAGAGKVSGRGELTLEFDRISPPGRGEIPIEAEPLQRRARATVKKDAKKVGGGAVIGAVVGGLLGGKKGAAIGGAVGGTAGAGAVLATKGEEVVLKEGVRFEVRLRAPVRLTLPAPES